MPLSGWWTPARILTSVLLPAPFSPTSAWTSPGAGRATRRRAPGSPRTAWRRRAARPGPTGAAAPASAVRSPDPIAASVASARSDAAGPAVDEPDLDAARRERRRPSRRAPRRRSGRRRCSSVRQNVANAARSHFVWSTMAMTSRAAATIERLICASSSVASERPESSANPAAPMNAVWTLIRSNRPSPSGPTTDSASQRTQPPGISDRDARVAGELRGDPQAVGDDRQVAPAAARLEVAGHREGRRAGVEGDALAVVDERRRRPRRSRPSRRAGAARGRRTRAPAGCRSSATAPPWVRTSRCSASRASRSLRIVTVETPNWRGEVGDAGAAVLLDEAGDVLLALPGEDVARRGAGRDRSRRSSVVASDVGDSGVSIGAGAR